MLEWEQQYCGPQADPGSALCQGGGQHQWHWHDGEQGVEVQFGEPGRVKAESLSIHNLLDGFLIARCHLLRGGTGELVEEAEFHRHLIAGGLPEGRHNLCGKQPQPLPVVEPRTARGDDDVGYPNIKIGLHLTLDRSDIPSQDHRTHLFDTQRLHLRDLRQ